MLVILYMMNRKSKRFFACYLKVGSSYACDDFIVLNFTTNAISSNVDRCFSYFTSSTNVEIIDLVT